MIKMTKMKKLKYILLTGMVLASVALDGCGKKSDEYITKKEIYKDYLQPLTEDELEEMDADTSDEDMKQIDDPGDEEDTSSDSSNTTKTK